MIYLDYAATSLYKPNEVYLRSDEVFKKYSANAGRSSHLPALNAAEIIFSSRVNAADFLGLKKPENVVFTFGCTDSLNLTLKGLLKAGDHVIATAYEHNSVLRPLEYMRKYFDIEYTVVFPDDGEKITVKNIKKHIRKNTKAMVANYVSNVTGTVQDIKEFGNFLKKAGILFIIDGAQALGVQDIKDIPFDYICCAGHKGLYGPQGIGILGINKASPLPCPLRFGGTGSKSHLLDQPKDMPEYLESGTLSVQNIAALEAGMTFAKNNREKIYIHETRLAQKLIDGLNENKKVHLYSPKKAKSGVVAFNILNEDSNQIADILDKKYAICCRGGFHCAPMVHKYLGTAEQGAVRLSIGYFNTEDEISTAIKAINEITAAV